MSTLDKIYKVSDNLKRTLQAELDMAGLKFDEEKFNSDDFEADWNDTVDELIMKILFDEEEDDDK